jgi:hypothetical protein
VFTPRGILGRPGVTGDRSPEMDATIIGCLAFLAEMADQTGRQARAQPEQAAVTMGLQTQYGDGLQVAGTNGPMDPSPITSRTVADAAVTPRSRAL